MPIRSTSALRAAAALTALFLSITGAPLHAQAGSLPTAAEVGRGQSSAPTTPVALDPFEVQADKDNSYGANSSTSLARFNTDIDKTPVVGDFFTAQFMEDVGTTTLEDLFNNYGAGAGMVQATPESNSVTNQPGTYDSSQQFAVRGEAAGSARINGFLVTSTNSNANSTFNIERVDILHGSQGLLYGATGAGGVINMVTKQARQNDATVATSYKFNNYGGKVANLDVNDGSGWFAFRGDINQTDNRYRLTYTGDELYADYGQMAFFLPLRSILRVSATTQHDDRIFDVPTTVNLGGVTVDPRSGDQLAYLYLTNQLGATNPLTGAAYPKGAIDNGLVNSSNYSAFAGDTAEQTVDTNSYEGSLDTAWTPWLATSFGALWQFNTTLSGSRNVPALIAPGASTTVPAALSNDWVQSNTFGAGPSVSRQKEYRASALVTNDLFGFIHNQMSIGFDRNYADSASVTEAYYLTNSDGSVPYNTAASNLGRTVIPTVFWSVNNGPVLYPYAKVGAKSLNYNGSLYTLGVANPRSPSYVTANNPLGLASLYPGITGVTGTNSTPYTSQTKTQGYYIADFASMWNDRVNLFMGLRESTSFTRAANASATTSAAYTESRTPSNPSYNAGVDFATKWSWLRGYASYSRTYNNILGAADPYGDIPPNPTGHTYEGGLKFNAPNLGLSGNLSAYDSDDKNDNYNAGGNFENIVNPTGLNGAYVGPQGTKNQWAIFDKQSRGLELLLTATPTKGWRLRYSINATEATVESTSSYKMLYNDQFYLNSAGNVTYGNNGPVVMVPTDTAGLALVAKQTSAINLSNPASTAYANSTLVPLTLGMINTQSSPYYAFGSGTLPQNQPLNGSIGQPIQGNQGTQYLKNVLANFQNNGVTALTGVTGLPFSAMQYAFADPAGYQGVYTVQKKGDRVVGTPAISMNIANTYDFSDGFLKGFSLGGSVGAAWYVPAFYYLAADHTRHLFSAPNSQYSAVHVWLKYSRKLGRVWLVSQLNIDGLFNHYNWVLYPNNGTGYSTVANVGATLFGTPRQYSWNNTLKF